jgi:hypothetical protein
MRFNISKWANILEGEPVFIIGNAPSLNDLELGLLDGCFTLGINRCFKAYDPTVLMWQDRGMYASDGIDDIRQTQSIKVCRDTADDYKEFCEFKIQKGNFSFDIEQRGSLKGFGCTGALAAQLAVYMGAGSLILLGCDGKYGKTTDFYGDNPDHQKHTLDNFRRAYRFIHDQCPVPVISCSDNDLWPRQELGKAIESLNIQKKTRVQWVSVFLARESN